MSGVVGIALFVALLALAFGVAAMAGSALDADPDADETHAPAGSGSGEEHRATGHGTGTAEEDQAGGDEAASTPAGLALAEERLRLDMPLIVVRRDLTGFQHLHPEMAPDGSWSTSVELTEPGSYRVFADFKSGGASHTLGAGVHVAGQFEPHDLPHPSERATTGDGYEARLTEDDGQLRCRPTRPMSSAACSERAGSSPWSATGSTTPPRLPRQTSGSRSEPAPTWRSRPPTSRSSPATCAPPPTPSASRARPYGPFSRTWSGLSAITSPPCRSPSPACSIPVIAGAAMALSSVSVVTNALRLRRFQAERDGGPGPDVAERSLPRPAGRAGVTARGVHD